MNNSKPSKQANNGVFRKQLKLVDVGPFICLSTNNNELCMSIQFFLFVCFCEATAANRNGNKNVGLIDTNDKKCPKCPTYKIFIIISTQVPNFRSPHARACSSTIGNRQTRCYHDGTVSDERKGPPCMASNKPKYSMVTS